ncbi:MAG TPA: hypothetical protein VIR26_01275 [Metalysinibacillus sp.]
MKLTKNVESTADHVPHIEVNVDTVYIRENIKWVEKEGALVKVYDETQMTLREYQESESDLLRQEKKRREELENIIMALTTEI